MNDGLLQRSRRTPVDIVPMAGGDIKKWLEGRAARVRRWVESTGFQGKPASHCLVPSAGGSLEVVLAGIDSADDPFSLAQLPAVLPAGSYRIAADWPAERLERAATGWALGAYQFTRYKKQDPIGANLVVASAASLRRVRRLVAGLYRVRDLVNTPAEDMNPAHLAEAVKHMAGDFDARVSEVAGNALLKRNFPAIHAVGRAASQPPRLIDLRWGKKNHPKLTLVGKGVCFDSGGLDIKTASGMRLMKKDMGGAAHALGLAHLIMRPGCRSGCGCWCRRWRTPSPATPTGRVTWSHAQGPHHRDRQHRRRGSRGAVRCPRRGRHRNPRAARRLRHPHRRRAGGRSVPISPAMFCNDDAVAEGSKTAARVPRPGLATAAVSALPRAHRQQGRRHRQLRCRRLRRRHHRGALPPTLRARRAPLGALRPHGVEPERAPGRPEGGEAMALRALFDYLENRYGKVS